MIIKYRTIPLRIKVGKVLLRRLPKYHKKLPIIEEDLSKRLAGYHGEQSLDYHLSFLPKNDFFIFNDLRLINNHSSFQIDTLILTTSFALILEVKNISGTLYFDQSFGQFIRKIDDKEERFPDPLSQVRRQQINLRNWMLEKKVDNLPIEYLVVISNPNTIVKTTAENQFVFQKVVLVEYVVERIKELKNYYGRKIVKQEYLEKLSELLIKHHSTYSVDIQRIFSIQESDIIRGVQCPACQKFAMNRFARKWLCSSCNTGSKSAHEQAIIDYFLLMNPTITNQQCREFLLIESQSTANKLLSSMNLITIGSNRGRKYQLPPHFEA